MQISSREVVLNFLQFAQDAEILAAGRLMSPREIDDFRFEDGSRIRAEISGWTFCGDVNPTMLDMLAQGEPVSHSVAIWKAPLGTPVLVQQQQAGEWAHRFIVALAGRTVRECIAAIGRTQINLSLSKRFGETALVLPIPFSTEWISALEQTVPLENVAATTLANDLVSASLRFLRPDAMEGHCEGIRTACVSAVWTHEMKALLEAYLPSVSNAMH